eukprot:349759-Chlamydomonas_euryale.AAC.1
MRVSRRRPSRVRTWELGPSDASLPSRGLLTTPSNSPPCGVSGWLPAALPLPSSTPDASESEYSPVACCAGDPTADEPPSEELPARSPSIRDGTPSAAAAAATVDVAAAAAAAASAMPPTPPLLLPPRAQGEPRKAEGASWSWWVPRAEPLRPPPGRSCRAQIV